MKKILTLACFVFITTQSIAQIKLEKTISDDYAAYNTQFSAHGYKLCGIILNDYKLRFYDEKLNLWKTINIPRKADYRLDWVPYVLISDKLFNNDDLIEYVAIYQGATQSNVTYRTGEVLNENGQVLASFPSTAKIFSLGLLYWGKGKYKLSIYNSNTEESLIYSLPGTKPCDDCGSPTGIPKPGKGTANSNIVVGSPTPNPANGNVTITYSLPADMARGELVITNPEGKTVKRVPVSNQQNQINVNMGGVSNGMYYFYIQTSASRSDTKKLVFVR